MTGSRPLENIPKKQPGMSACFILQDIRTVKNGSYLSGIFIYQEVNSIAINQNWRTAGAGQGELFNDFLQGKSRPGRSYRKYLMESGLLSQLLILRNLRRIGMNKKCHGVLPKMSRSLFLKCHGVLPEKSGKAVTEYFKKLSRYIRLYLNT